MMGYGYETESGDRISALIDMINGGGPGRSGDTFEGGGILSLLANAVARPYGSVRERPGHSPVGGVPGSAPMAAPARAPMAAPARAPMAAPAREYRTVDELVRDTLLAIEEPVAAPGEAAPGTITREPLEEPLGPLSREFTPRAFTAEDLAALDRAPPDLAVMFRGILVGELLEPREVMILDALRASASFNPSVNPRRPVALNDIMTRDDFDWLVGLPAGTEYFEPGGRFEPLLDMTVGDRATGPAATALRDLRLLP